MMQNSSTSKTTIYPTKMNPVKLAQEANSIQVAPSSSSFGVESQPPHSRAHQYPINEPMITEEPSVEERKHPPSQSPITFADPPSSSMHEQEEDTN